jgi:DNA-binding transcriptional LysR family regulator
MLQHQIEVALVEGPIHDEGLDSDAWLTDVMALIVGPNHPFSSATEPIEPRELAKETLIVREPGSGSREVVIQAIAKMGIEPVELSRSEALKRLNNSLQRVSAFPSFRARA